MPRLETFRLLLRPPDYRDVAAITTWLGDYDVAKNLATVPHPYREEDAHAFIGRTAEQLARGEGYCFTIERKEDGVLVGNCSLKLKDGRYELGYWIAKQYWGRGYATEAVRRLTAFAFRDLKADSLRAGWYHDNPASGRVLEKVGFLPDGAEPRGCLARGHEVYCHLTALTRADFGRKRSPVAAGAEAR